MITGGPGPIGVSVPKVAVEVKMLSTTGLGLSVKKASSIGTLHILMHNRALAMSENPHSNVVGIMCASWLI